MVCWFTQNPSQGWRFLIHINSLRMQFKFKSNKPWNTETPRLATSWPLGERSEPFLAAKRPNASDEGLFWKSKKHRHKTDRNPPITNQKPWSIDWPLENTYSSFLRGQLRCKGQFRFDWRRRKPQTPNTFLTSPVGCYPKQLVAFLSKLRKREWNECSTNHTFGHNLPVS